MKIERVEDMPVYQLFYKLALDVEKVTRAYPPEFRWLRGQSLRASESVPANMTEGFYAQYSTEYLHALYTCRREARETMTHLTYARDVKLLDQKIVADLLESYESGTKQLGSLIISIERKIETSGKGKSAAKAATSTINHGPLTMEPLVFHDAEHTC